MHVACENGHGVLVAHLVAAGADVEAVNGVGLTPSQVSASQEIADLLLGGSSDMCVDVCVCAACGVGGAFSHSLVVLLITRP